MLFSWMGVIRLADNLIKLAFSSGFGQAFVFGCEDGGVNTFVKFQALSKTGS